MAEYLFIGCPESSGGNRKQKTEAKPSLMPFLLSTRVIPRIHLARSDKLSFEALFEDSLSNVSDLRLATTLENLQIVPHSASGAVFADGGQRACLSVQRT
jgi:hypothetical protein